MPSDADPSGDGVSRPLVRVAGDEDDPAVGGEDVSGGGAAIVAEAVLGLLATDIPSERAIVAVAFALEAVVAAANGEAMPVIAVEGRDEVLERVEEGRKGDEGMTVGRMRECEWPDVDRLRGTTGSTGEGGDEVDKADGSSTRKAGPELEEACASSLDNEDGPAVGLDPDRGKDRV